MLVVRIGQNILIKDYMVGVNWDCLAGQAKSNRCMGSSTDKPVLVFEMSWYCSKVQPKFCKLGRIENCCFTTIIPPSQSQWLLLSWLARQALRGFDQWDGLKWLWRKPTTSKHHQQRRYPWLILWWLLKLRLYFLRYLAIIPVKPRWHGLEICPDKLCFLEFDITFNVLAICRHELQHNV